MDELSQWRRGSGNGVGGGTLNFVEPEVVVALRFERLDPLAHLRRLGLALGHRIGTRFGRGLEVFGGIALIGLGTKTLVEHLAA